MTLARAFVLAAALFLLSPAEVRCEGISINGFVQGNYSLGTAGSNPDGGDFKWAEERVQLKFEASKEPLRLFIKTDAFHDWIDEDFETELREGFVEYVAGKWDVRAGRQIITWGLGDLIFINDIFPKDYEAFFSGRPIEYFKKGIDGVKLGLYPTFASFELVAVPFFEPNNFPKPERFHMFDPMPQITNREKSEPATSLENTEIAVRAYRDIAGYDASIYFYRGFFRQPSAIPDDLLAPSRLSLVFPELNVYGASLQGRAIGGVISLEGGYYDFREDREGDDPFTPNSQTRFLVGYQRQMRQDFTVGLQYYGEYMHDYSEYSDNLLPEFPKERRLRDLVTVRLTQLLRHQTLRLSFFSFYSLSDGDYMLNPEVKYNFTDNVWAAVGGNIFGGNGRATQFGQLDENDNVYVQVRYEF